MEYSSYVAILLLGLCCLFGILLSMVRLPGPWLILLAALAYGWWTEWQYVGIGILVMLLAMGCVAELLEFVATVITARRSGASSRAAWGGLLGALGGVVFLSFLVPIPLVGSVMGALVGCFIGAVLGELTVRNDLLRGTSVGFFAAIGFIAGMIAKLAMTITMAAILMTLVIAGEWPGEQESSPQPNVVESSSK